MKYAKDTRARKEWGSNELLVIDDEYVPLPDMNDYLKLELSIDQTSSTSSSEGVSNDNKTNK